MPQMRGTIRAEITGLGQYETTFASFEAVQEMYGTQRLPVLQTLVKEEGGYSDNPDYRTSGLTRTECIMILAELRGLATN